MEEKTGIELYIEPNSVFPNEVISKDALARRSRNKKLGKRKVPAIRFENADAAFAGGVVPWFLDKRSGTKVELPRGSVLEIRDLKGELIGRHPALCKECGTKTGRLCVAKAEEDPMYKSGKIQCTSCGRIWIYRNIPADETKLYIV